MALLDLKHVTLSLGGPELLSDVSLRIGEGERVCLLGRNGVGKTTLLRLLSGELAPASGEVERRPGLRIGFLPQEVPGGLGGTVRDVVAAGLADVAGDTPDWEIQTAVERTLTRASLDPGSDFDTLSAGSKRRTLLARALVVEPDLLLLDEPTNHLDIDAIEWLEGELRRFRGALFFVTHDRAFLRALAGRIIELDRGRLLDWTCDYDTFLSRREAFLADERARRAEFDRKLAEEEIWIRQGVRERRTRNEGRVRELKRMREERRVRRELTSDPSFRLQDVERSGRLVIRAQGLGYAWGDLPIVRDLDTMIMRGDKVGLLGPNGSGKTTLLRLLLGEIEPDAGSVRLGTNLRVAYFDQQRDQLDLAKTVQENVTEGGDKVAFDGRTLHVITYLQQFLFTPDRIRAPITHLSGGERNRLLLAKLFTQPANLLVLDEPTNDLDMETLELLEELLLDFDGTLLLVSHDRQFLDNVTTSTLALEGDGRVAETVGGYSDWARVSLARREAQKPVEQRPKEQRRKPRSGGPRKLSWKEGKELESLPARIEELEAEQASLHASLADPELYRQDPARVAVLRRRLEELGSELAAGYARWEELDALDR